MGSLPHSCAKALLMLEVPTISGIFPCRQTVLGKKLAVMWFHGLTSVSSSAPQSHLLTSPQWDGGRIRKVKGRNLIGLGWDKDNLIGKAKGARTEKAKPGINSPPPMGRQVFCHLPPSSPAPYSEHGSQGWGTEISSAQACSNLIHLGPFWSLRGKLNQSR